MRKTYKRGVNKDPYNLVHVQDCCRAIKMCQRAVGGAI